MQVVEEILRSVRADLENLEKDSKRGDLVGSYDQSRLSKASSPPRDIIERARSLRTKGIDPIIAEIKPRVLGRALMPGEVAQIARHYEEMGACAISVLTQPVYFMGSVENLKIARESTSASIPILRKDFILDERQFEGPKSDLILLIVAFSQPLDDLIEAARARGMEPLVEVHTDEELNEALKTDARIIGINNRNLKTLEINLGTFERLGPIAKASGAFVIAESGVESRNDVSRMIDAGADALLVGTSLMKEPTKLMELNGLGR